jgi:hypothetical protein
VTGVMKICLRNKLHRMPICNSQNEIKSTNSRLSMITMNSEIEKPRKSVLRIHRASCLMIVAAIIIVASVFLSPVFSLSSSPCGSCHG